MSQDSLAKYKYENKLPKKSKFFRLLWDIVYLLFFRITPRWTCHRWRVFLLRAFGAKIGDHCIIAPSCKIWAPWNLEIGSYVCFADNVDCYTVDKIKIGSKVTISQRTFLCTASHEISTLRRELTHKMIEIHDHAWICAEAFVGPGIEIGEGAVVGARAVVIADVAAWDVVAGNPAKVIKQRKITEPPTD